MSQQRRRQFLFVLAAGALIGIRQTGLAQQNSRVWRVGFIGYGGRTGASADEFAKGMRDLGYELGKNLAVEWRFAEGHIDRIPELVADVVNRKVDVLIANDTPTVAAVKRATTTIPVVMTTVGDPVGSGIVASLARPGGNITGLSLANADVAAKWLELARTVAPQSRIGVLADFNQPTVQTHVRNIQNAARTFGVIVPVAKAREATELEGAFASLIHEGVKAVIVLPSGLFNLIAEKIAELALRHRMASIGTARSYAEGGLLVSYGQSYAAFVRRAAIYVDKILRGAKPSELPIEQPMILELVINRTTAKKLGLTIPAELLLRSHDIIE